MSNNRLAEWAHQFIYEKRLYIKDGGLARWHTINKANDSCSEYEPPAIWVIQGDKAGISLRNRL